jgi:hypothetical protein
VKNRVKCLQCGEILESTHVHDFRMCKCSNNTFTDGGLDYQRIGGKDFSMIQIIDDYGNPVERK